MGTVTDAAIDCTRRPIDAALWLARAFVDGRRLAVRAPGADDHAHHVAVEFVHPVIAGARPLPVVVIEQRSESSSDDVLLLIGDDPSPWGAHLVISTDQPDIDIVRSYHLLWELVHVALEHPGLVGADAGAGGDSTGFLYPFLDAAETDAGALRDALTASAQAKIADSTELVADTLLANADALETAACAAAAVTQAGGRIHTMGNGGSATDAARLARLLQSIGAASLPLSSDYAVVTALANDVGVERVFARQVEALTRPGDLLVGCSTSGTSPNLLAAFRAADSRGLSTVGISGYGGDSFAVEPSVHHRLDVGSSSVHRIQEAQAALMTELCAAVAHRISARREPGKGPG